jgi:hypothetical protein
MKNPSGAQETRSNKSVEPLVGVRMQQNRWTARSRGWVPLNHLAVFEMQSSEAMEKRPMSDDRQAPMLSAHPGPEFFYTS